MDNLLAAIGGMSLLLIFLGIGVGVMCLVAWCKLFRKAGEPVGFVFIPVFGTYKTFAVAGCPGLFGASIAVAIGSSLLSQVISCAAAPTTSGYYSSYSAYESARSMLSVLLVIMIVALVAELIIHIFFCKSLAHTFGKGGGFAAGLYFLYPVFLMILAFGPAEHRYARASRMSRSPEKPTWTCTKCGTPNLRHNMTCIKCGANRPMQQAVPAAQPPQPAVPAAEQPTAPAAEQKDAPAAETGDQKRYWVCAKCGGFNSGSRNDCVKCGAQKPET